MRVFVFVAFLSGAAFGQPTDRFEAADVHASPRSSNNFNLFMRGPQTRAGRYEIRTATMVDLISTAYGVDGDKVFGGPNWLEMDRFDITATLPAGSTPDRQKAMLRALLADRYHLVAHPDTKPMSAYVMTAGRRPLLKDADSAAQKGCQGKPRPQNAEPNAPNELACHGLTAAEIAENLHDMAGGYLKQPVVDATELKGTYDFDLRWTSRGQLAAAGADGISVFDAVEKQLGLKLTLQKSPLPVVVVESVDQSPTENAPDLGTILPGVAVPKEFEVALVKLTPPDAQNFRRSISSMVSLNTRSLVAAPGITSCSTPTLAAAWETLRRILVSSSSNTSRRWSGKKHQMYTSLCGLPIRSMRSFGIRWRVFDPSVVLKRLRGS